MEFDMSMVNIRGLASDINPVFEQLEKEGLFRKAGNREKAVKILHFMAFFDYPDMPQDMIVESVKSILNYKDSTSVSIIKEMMKNAGQTLREGALEIINKNESKSIRH